MIKLPQRLYRGLSYHELVETHSFSEKQVIFLCPLRAATEQQRQKSPEALAECDCHLLDDLRWPILGHSTKTLHAEAYISPETKKKATCTCRPNLRHWCLMAAHHQRSEQVGPWSAPAPSRALHPTCPRPRPRRLFARGPLSLAVGQA